MNKLKLFLFITTIVSVVGSVQSMVFDNRFLPLLWHPFITAGDRPSHVRAEFLAVTGNRSYDEHKDEQLLPAIYGPYDQGELANSFVDIGCDNPLKSEWQGAKIPWKISGKLQGQGFAFWYHQVI